jgi:hypothetical protein
MLRRRLFSLACLSALAAALACGPGDNTNTPGADAGPVGPRTCTVDGLTVTKPLERARLRGGGTPDFSCIASPEPLPAPKMVTAEGCLDIFGLGSKTKPGLRAAFYRADQNLSDAPAFGETDIATYAGGSADAGECETEGFYRLPAVATSTPLLIKVYDTATGPAQTAIPTYTYHKVLRDELIDENDVVNYEVNLVYKTTYDSIPTLGGKRIDGQSVVYDGEGRGVIAGEVHDCNGALVQHASVTSSQLDSNTKIAYFDGEADPKPAPALTATNSDALYVVLNAKTDPGENDHKIVAVVLDPACEEASPADCECVLAGSGTVQVFPDSVVIYSPEGVH